MSKNMLMKKKKRLLTISLFIGLLIGELCVCGIQQHKSTTRVFFESKKDILDSIESNLGTNCICRVHASVPRYEEEYLQSIETYFITFATDSGEVRLEHDISNNQICILEGREVFDILKNDSSFYFDTYLRLNDQISELIKGSEFKLFSYYNWKSINKSRHLCEITLFHGDRVFELLCAEPKYKEGRIKTAYKIDCKADTFSINKDWTIIHFSKTLDQLFGDR